MGMFNGLFKSRIEKLKAKRDVDGLIKALSHKEWKIRVKAAVAIATLGDTRGLEFLIAALKDNEADVPQAAAKALGQVGDARAVEPLLATLNDKDCHMREAAARALDALEWQPVDDTQRASRAIALNQYEEAASLGAAAVGPLVAVLESDNLSLQVEAAKALGKIRDVRAVKPLLAVLESDLSLRIEAIKALGKIRDVRAVKPLLETLKKVAWHWVLLPEMDIKGGEKLELVFRVLISAVVGALAQIGSRSVEPLISTFMDINEDAKSHYIGKLPFEDRARITWDDSARRLAERAAEKMMEGIRNAAGDSLLEALAHQESLKTAAELLGRIRCTQAVDILIATLKTEDKEVQSVVATSLGYIGGSKAERALAEYHAQQSS